MERVLPCLRNLLKTYRNSHQANRTAEVIAENIEDIAVAIEVGTGSIVAVIEEGIENIAVHAVEDIIDMLEAVIIKDVSTAAVK
ncbi:hypothetical protein [Oceanobacillus luteolus]|uniref:DUF503 family protein n=1 Tax=Oceanobacillus luteolus TaxID=1274358 RepID=A0ABW4HUD4_9BACI